MLIQRNDNEILTCGEAALIGFCTHLLEHISPSKREEKIKSFEKLKDMFQLNYCVATGEIIKRKR
jgi:hypothetical protein